MSVPRVWMRALYRRTRLVSTRCLSQWVGGGLSNSVADSDLQPSRNCWKFEM